MAQGGKLYPTFASKKAKLMTNTNNRKTAKE
jgi:hypothetical protein